MIPERTFWGNVVIGAVIVLVATAVRLACTAWAWIMG